MANPRTNCTHGGVVDLVPGSVVHTHYTGTSTHDILLASQLPSSVHGPYERWLILAMTDTHIVAMWVPKRPGETTTITKTGSIERAWFDDQCVKDRIRIEGRP